MLRLDDGGKDLAHVEACRKAILAYASAIAAHTPKLASDIQSRYGEMKSPGWPKPTARPVTVTDSTKVQIGNHNTQIGEIK